MSRLSLSRYSPICLIFVPYLALSNVHIGPEHIIRPDLSKKDTEIFTTVNNLHSKWYLTATSNLLNAIGNRIFRRLEYRHQIKLLDCQSSIRNKRDIEKKAKCIGKAFMNERNHANLRWIGEFGIAKNEDTRYAKKISGQNEMKSYQKSSQNEGIQYRRRKRSHYRLTYPKHKKIRQQERVPNLMSKNLLSFRKNSSQIGNALQILTKFLHGKNDQHSWQNSYEKIKNIRQKMKQYTKSIERINERGKYLDAVSGGNIRRQAKEGIVLSDAIEEFARDLDKQDITHRFRILSPSLVPLFPKKQNKKSKIERILSPAIFPLYRDQNIDDILPIPKIIDSVRMTENDKESLMDFIMEISGTRSSVDWAFNIINEKYKLSEIDKSVLEAEDRMFRGWTTMTSDFSNRQKDDLKSDGFSFLDRKQLEVFYGSKGIYNYVDMQIDMNVYEQWSDTEKEDLLEYTVAQLANDNSTMMALRKWGNRQKTFPILFGEHSILHPVVLSPKINEGLLLGPFILSPELLSPDIIAPLALSPFILNPMVLSPFILSPLVLNPFILSPTVLNPTILSPNVLSPTILNPHALSPLILNPFALSPDILSPFVLGGEILSPHVLSPPIDSPSALSLNLLSPTFLEESE